MDKEEFVNQKVEDGINEELAKTAWETADESDAEEANKLLELERVYIKSSIHAPEKKFTGYFALEWNDQKKFVETLEAIMVSGTSYASISPHVHWREFCTKMADLSRSAQGMRGYTDQLTEGLNNLFSDENSEIRELVDNKNYDDLEDVVQDFIAQEFGFSDPRIDLDYTTERRMEDVKEEESDEGGSQKTSSEDDEEKEEIVLECDTEINPVRGVPVTKLGKGDLIYVELGDVDPSKEAIKSRLEEEADESGYIKAMIKDKSVNEAENTSMRVKFGKRVFGKCACSQDVSILVPEETRNDTGSGGEMSGSFDGMNEQTMIIIMVIVILLIAAMGWYILF